MKINPNLTTVLTAALDRYKNLQQELIEDQTCDIDFMTATNDADITVEELQDCLDSLFKNKISLKEFLDDRNL